jgi:hypothetical protein
MLNWSWETCKIFLSETANLKLASCFELVFSRDSLEDQARPFYNSINRKGSS